MTAIRPLGRALAWAAAGLIAGLTMAIAAPLAFDGRPYTVLSGSMEPAIAAGDLVIAKRIAPLDVAIGDVVTFQDPDEAGRLVTHRVGGMRREGRRVEFVTKGDANTSVEQWRVSTGDDLGRVAYRIPWIGHAAAPMRSNAGLAGLAIVLLLLMANELARIWRPERKAAPGEPHA